jgi:hypothetical protein
MIWVHDVAASRSPSQASLHRRSFLTALAQIRASGIPARGTYLELLTQSFDLAEDEGSGAPGASSRLSHPNQAADVLRIGPICK